MVLDVQDSEEQNLIRLFPGCVPCVPDPCHYALTHFTHIGPNNSLTRLYPPVAECWYIAMVRGSGVAVPIACMLTGMAGGISLSPSFVVMYVMQQHNLSMEDALHLVQNRRYCISPNGGFISQLKVCPDPP